MVISDEKQGCYKRTKNVVGFPANYCYVLRMYLKDDHVTGLESVAAFRLAGPPLASATMQFVCETASR
jgi:hypothetical protein